MPGLALERAGEALHAGVVATPTPCATCSLPARWPRTSQPTRTSSNGRRSRSGRSAARRPRASRTQPAGWGSPARPSAAVPPARPPTGRRSSPQPPRGALPGAPGRRNSVTSVAHSRFGAGAERIWVPSLRRSRLDGDGSPAQLDHARHRRGLPARPHRAEETKRARLGEGRETHHARARALGCQALPPIPSSRARTPALSPAYLSHPRRAR